MELDPNFALAYVDLGIFYNFETNLAAENLRKAYELRERVSEREKFYISATYYTTVTGELEKAVQQYELWIQEYPRDQEAYDDLAVVYVTSWPAGKSYTGVTSKPWLSIQMTASLPPTWPRTTSPSIAWTRPR